METKTTIAVTRECVDLMKELSNLTGEKIYSIATKAIGTYVKKRKKALAREAEAK